MREIPSTVARRVLVAVVGGDDLAGWWAVDDDDGGCWEGLRTRAWRPLRLSRERQMW